LVSKTKGREFESYRPCKDKKKMASIKTYFEESYSELVHKVSWPSWKDLQSSAVVVLIASLIIALIVFAMDYVFGINAGDSGEVIWKGILGFFYDFIS
jgi:preprotein translocase subunit SecE